MAVEDSVAQDQIRAFVERIERLEEEKKAIAEDIKSIYSEAKGSGFDVKILRRVVGIRKQDANERMEQEAILELYMSALGMVPAPDEEVYDGERERLNSIAAQLRAAPTKPKADPLAALRADPTLAIVEAATITPKTQPTKAAGSDLTSLAPHDGQVAPNSDIGSPISNEAPMAVYGDSEDEPTGHLSESVEILPGGVQLSKDGRVDASPAVVNSAPDATPAGSVVDDASGVTGGESAASKYAEKGVVVWEHTPPGPVRRHPYSAAFGDLGQDLVVIDDDIAGAKSDPIVRIGNEILDGWARYNVARGMIGGSGMSTEYPVMQYAGTDPLLDCIRLNVAGRVLSPKDKQTVAQRLIAIEPKRRAEILKVLAEQAV